MYQLFFLALILALVFIQSTTSASGTTSSVTTLEVADTYNPVTRSCGIDNLGGHDLPTDANAY